jgi:hypothetical protein
MLRFGTFRAMPITSMEIRTNHSKRLTKRLVLLASFCLSCVLVLPNCGSTSGNSTGPGTVLVTIQPASASVLLGETQTFTASVTGTANTGVTWNVNGFLGGSPAIGTISPNGIYNAPAILPSPATVTISAVSQTNIEASASVTVNLHDDIVVTLSPPSANLPTNGGQVFTATITATGSPAPGVTWSVSGISGGNAAVGTIVSNGPTSALYTAPALLPSPSAVTVTATSIADTSKFGTASITITCSATNSISPPAASVTLGQTQVFTVSFCLASGSSVTWDANGITGGNATLGTIVNATANTALYTTPMAVPSTNPITIHATAPSQSGGNLIVASASVTVTSNIAVNIIPSSASVPVNQRKSFAATVTNSADGSVTWSVNGITNGNLTSGQICVTGSNPCATPVGPVSGSVDFLAPASVPGTNPVQLTATSHADNSKSATAMVVITGSSQSVTVSVSPLYAFVAPSGGTLSTFQFFAAVTGSPNTGVTWSVQSAVAGQGCGGAACGSVDGSGLYSSPSVAPSPNAISVIATSLADPTKSAAATIALTSGPVIEKILPSSVMAGAVEGLPLALAGQNFIVGSGATASTILINGTSRGTTCTSATSCATALNPADVQSATTLTIEVQNPGAPGMLSNPVPLVVVPFDVSESIIPLTASASVASGTDMIVTEPTTAAASAPLDVDSIGLLTGGDNCGFGASPLSITRPASGAATVSLCIHGNGLDASMAYKFSGPDGSANDTDIGVTASPVVGLFPNTIELDLQVSSTTLPGLRALFITTLNNDRAIATGMLEVK